MTIKQKFYNIGNYNEQILELIDVQINELKTEKLALIESIKNDLNEINQISKEIKLKNFLDLVVIGIGGSSLSSKIFTNYKIKDSKISIHYLENIDEEQIEYVFDKINFNKTVFFVISKSGNTFETVAIFDLLIQRITKSYSNYDISKHIYVIVEFTDNIIYNKSRSLNVNLIQHKDIGGRFSSFTNVGLIIASLVGLNIENIKLGAINSLADLDSNAGNIRKFLLNFIMIKAKITNIVIMPYSNKLKGLAKLFRQIWSESLGKDNFNITPIDSIGSIDQHSQLELYLGGAKDKLYNIITLNQLYDNGKKLLLGEACGKTINELLSIEAHATIESLIKAGCYVRHIELDNPSEYDLGNLLANFMFEIILIARILSINPFNQPKVEENKILIAKKLLE